jgi:SAM-dependent methyltransferase
MHKSSILRMSWFVDHYVSKVNSKQKLKVLDVGSFDVNGSYKHLFPKANFDYTGLDMEAGPNVDIVLNNPYNWNEIETDSCDIVISGQAFEHIEFFWITMSEMARILKKGGLLCILAPNGFEEHRYPVDCYRFFTDGMVALARYVSLEPLHAHTNLAPSVKQKDWYSESCADSMLIARKDYSGKPKFVDLQTYVCTPPNHGLLNSNLIPPPEPGLFKRVLKKLLGFANKG